MAGEGLQDSVQSHEVQIEIMGRSSCGEAVVLRVDEIGADFEGARVESALGEGGEEDASCCCFARTAVERGQNDSVSERGGRHFGRHVQWE